MPSVRAPWSPAKARSGHRPRSTGPARKLDGRCPRSCLAESRKRRPAADADGARRTLSYPRRSLNIRSSQVVLLLRAHCLGYRCFLDYHLTCQLQALHACASRQTRLRSSPVASPRSVWLITHDEPAASSAGSAAAQEPALVPLMAPAPWRSAVTMMTVHGVVDHARQDR